MRTRLMAALLCTLLPVAVVRGQFSQTLYPNEILSEGSAFATIFTGEASHPTVSDDGRYVVYEQDDTLFLVDRQAMPRTTIRVPNCDVGSPPDFCFQTPSDTRPRVSGDGRYVVFSTYRPMSGLGIDVNGAEDVYRWDRQSGAVQLVSVSAAGVLGNADSRFADVSRNGRYVAFESRATTLIAGESLSPNVTRVYWKDMVSGEVRRIPDGFSNAIWLKPRISADGLRVMAIRFQAVGNSPTSLWDVNTASKVSTGFDQYPGSSPDVAVISSDAQVSANVDLGSSYQVNRFWRFTENSATGFGFGGITFDAPFGGGIDLSAGGGHLAVHYCRFSTSLNRFSSSVYILSGNRVHYVSMGWGPNVACERGFDMTPNGRYMVMSAFDLWRPDWCSNCFGGVVGNPFNSDRDELNDIFLIENPLWQPLPQNVAAKAGGVPANSRKVQVSGDGNVVVFESEIPAGQLNPALVDSNGVADVFRFLRNIDSIELISSSDGVNAYPGGGQNPSMSQDGDRVVFEALDSGIAAKNLGPGGERKREVSYKASVRGVFLRNMTGVPSTSRISTSRGNGASNGHSQNPSISPDGGQVVFSTDADNVNPDTDSNGVRDVVLVELGSGLRNCVSHCPGAVANEPSDLPVVSNNRRVAFRSRAATLQKLAGSAKAGSAQQVFLRNMSTGVLRNVSGSGTTAPVPGNADSDRPVISANGDSVAFETAASNLPEAPADGRRHVYLYQVSTATHRRVSRDPAAGKLTAKLDGDSTAPQLSADGRFVAFQSAASTLVAQDLNGYTDVFVFDSQKRSLSRLASAFGAGEPNGNSQTPQLNRNGTRIGFESFAGNFSENSEGVASKSTTDPLTAANPLGLGIVFADAFD